MTETDKPVTRRSQRPIDRNKKGVFTIGPGDVLYMRLAGEKQSESIPLAACYTMAVKQRMGK